MPAPHDSIIVRQAHEHNLRHVDLKLPKNALIVFTGVSGSGKSSLAFDTLFVEGQRRYVESLSTYARQFLQQLGRPAVGHLEGLPPAIAIDQGSRSHNPRSTVATLTEIYDHLRVLYAAIGRRHCHQCGREIGSQTRETILGRILSLPAGDRVQILAPVVRGRKGEFRDLLDDLAKRGYLRARLDGQEIRLDEALPALDRYRRHEIAVIVDRFEIRDGLRARVAEAVDQALKLAEGLLIVARADHGDLLLSTRYACAHCDLSFEEPTHTSFSFNSPRGMCPTCQGLGVHRQFDPELLVPDPGKSLLDGAIPVMQSLASAFRRHWYEGVAAHGGFDLSTPWRDLTDAQRELLLHGTRGQKIEFVYRNRNNGWEWRHRHTWDGLLAELHERYRQLKAPTLLRRLEAAMRVGPCQDCHGQRLRPEVLAITVGGRSIAEVVALDVAAAATFFSRLRLSAPEQLIAEDALKEITGRLAFLNHVGLHYLTLDRLAPSLSGGEAQRIRLASQVGSGLVDCLYVLDEPSIGLHHSDQGKLLEALQQLRDQGNTVIVVEHDEQTMTAADLLVDFGPGAGEKGGRVIARGTPAQVARTPGSITGQYLSRKLTIPVPASRRAGTGDVLRIEGARHHNLRDVTVDLPLGQFICVTGLSGSGKSSLVTDTLHPALARDLQGAQTQPGPYTSLTGLEHLDKVLLIDQDPIGRTPRSNPATYTGVFTLIRDLYAELPEAKIRGYKPGRFSFNVAEGRCSACEGNGAIMLESDFLADVWVPCEVCEGQRFDRETLSIFFRQKHIADVLGMEVVEALEHFANQPRIRHYLQTLTDVGLGYIRLGQPATTLSGGEAQRVKLAKELVRPSTGRTMYILDEPTTGLHLHDVRQLLEVLHRFADGGNTVLVVEHHPDVIKSADHIVDLGPGGGAEGGRLVAQGTPERVARHRKSPTGAMLREVLSDRAPVLPKAAKLKRRPRPTHLVVKGAREHNLQDVAARIPLHQLTVITGVSGSGKTSLALDTLYAEGQRRFVESLSPYARQFVSQMPKPKVERVTGLPPAIAIDQSGRSYSPRSTVGTATELYDYLRVLFARIAQPHCPHCGEVVGAQTVDQVVDSVLAVAAGQQVLITAPLRPQGNEPYEALLQRLEREGWQRARIDGVLHKLPYSGALDRRRRHDLEAVVDRLTVGSRQRSRLAEAVEAAFRLGEGQVLVIGETPWRFSSRHACQSCGQAYDPLTPRSFSFNHPDGWCRTCYGLGTRRAVDLDALIADPTQSLRQGALRLWPDLRRFPKITSLLEAAAAHGGFTLDQHFDTLTPPQRAFLLHAACGEYAALPTDPELAALLATLPGRRELAQRVEQGCHRLLRDLPCPACQGARVRPEAAAARLRGRTIGDVCRLPLGELRDFFSGLALEPRERDRAADLLQEVGGRLRFLGQVGLDYLTLGRSAPTLSGGETQRVKLAGQLGCGLTGLLYVLDEPTVGVHPSDNARVLEALKSLRDEGNTLVVVEHDPQTLGEADYILDIGPGAGPHGGHLVASGTRAQVARRRESLTGQLLRGDLAIPVPSPRRPLPPGPDAAPDRWLVVEGAREHNLQDLTVPFPLGLFVVVTGPSGSGKSTLIEDTLGRELGYRLNGSSGDVAPGLHRALHGTENLDQLIVIDQTPIGQTPRSNPGTYVGAFDLIREFYAALPESRVRGYTPRRFSFNVPSGRCETCQGMGSRCVQMHFLPDVWVTCEECHGRRYNPETLAVTYRGKSIADVLEMSLGELRELFSAFPRLARKLQVLCDVGLGYLPLGQSAPTLSGGEAQRVKLARELSSPARGRALYLLDEPTTGLHTADVQQLLVVLNRLVDRGHTVIVIEHNLDVIKSADYLIELGPGGGDRGGQLVAFGPPELVAACDVSPTAPYLRPLLGTPS